MWCSGCTPGFSDATTLVAETPGSRYFAWKVRIVTGREIQEFGPVVLMGTYFARNEVISVRFRAGPPNGGPVVQRQDTAAGHPALLMLRLHAVEEPVHEPTSESGDPGSTPGGHTKIFDN